MEMSAIKCSRVDIDGFGVAYREAGPVKGPALQLLHGFPTSSPPTGLVYERRERAVLIITTDRRPRSAERQCASR